ncbi:hypothetical protein MMC28_010209, partial [Mycoblastus sanguinarius]|nr:hypothetical protein [Mycoblastus sanguinarius]
MDKALRLVGFTLFLSPLLFLNLASCIPFTTLPSDISNLTSVSRCTSASSWQARGFLIEDCFAAIQHLFIEEVLTNPDVTHEFVAGGTLPETKNPYMITPREYTVSSCTLAIVMLELFGPGELPGVQRRPFAMSDTASFREVYKAAKAVETDCLLPGKRPGWEPL